MRLWKFAYICVVPLTLFASDKGQKCHCGTIKYDNDYKNAVDELKSALRAMWYISPENITEVDCPYTMYCWIRDPSDQHVFAKEGFICWTLKFIDYQSFKYRVPSYERHVEWSSNLDLRRQNRDLVEDEKFVFHKDYHVFYRAFDALRKDSDKWYQRSVNFYLRRIKDIENGKIFRSEWGFLPSPKYKVEDFLKHINEIDLRFIRNSKIINDAEEKAIYFSKQSVDWCLKNHKNPIAHYNQGLFYFLEGETCDALDHISFALENMDEEDLNNLNAQAYLLKGQMESEVGLYAEAVIALTEAIKKNPLEKEAYLERASAYFELGDFDLSLSDYLSSGIKPKPIDPSLKDNLAFALGLSKGALQGGTEATIEFIPSLLSSAQGIGQALWGFALDPIQVSADFVDAAMVCVDYVKNNTPKDIIISLVPELQQMLARWDTLDNLQKGEVTGHVIGKYGVDIFAGAGVAKCMSAYRNLKKANNLLTFETAALSERNKTLIISESKQRAQNRKDILQSSNLKIQWDKQGKHIESHRNFDPKISKSVFEHANPNALIELHAGKGLKASSKTPGTAGYSEIVNFGEKIGYYVNEHTGERFSTTWGKIHYANDGVHIVPTKPRGAS